MLQREPLHRQAVSASVPRVGLRRSQIDPRSPASDSTGPTPGPLGAVGRRTGRHPGQARSALASGSRRDRLLLDDSACHQTTRLDTKKTLVATERDTVARAKWREVAAALDARRFVFVNETSSNITLTARSA